MSAADDVQAMIIVMTTVSTADAGETLAMRIVDAKLAACVQIMPQMRSIYRWQGETFNEAEHLLMIKTLPDRFDAVSQFIRENHAYEVPEIVAVHSTHASEEYFTWAKASLNGLE